MKQLATAKWTATEKQLYNLVKFNEIAEELNKDEFLVNNKLIEHKSSHKVLQGMAIASNLKWTEVNRHINTI